jgi:superfamily I DNA and RNA helicase
LTDLQEILATSYRISSNNIHADKFSIKDFQIQGRVTLSTVHKAKGNEAYSVYVVGVDALYTLDPTIKERNILFTAMTRSKGWLTVSGISEPAKLCCNEIEIAKRNFPYLEFKYPSQKDIKIMQRDIKEKAVRKSKAKKMLDELLNELSPEEIQRFIAHRTPKKKN